MDHLLWDGLSVFPVVRYARRSLVLAAGVEETPVARHRDGSCAAGPATPKKQNIKGSDVHAADGNRRGS